MGVERVHGFGVESAKPHDVGPLLGSKYYFMLFVAGPTLSHMEDTRRSLEENGFLGTCCPVP